MHAQRGEALQILTVGGPRACGEEGKRKRSKKDRKAKGPELLCVPRPASCSYMQIKMPTVSHGMLEVGGEKAKSLSEVIRMRERH